MAASDWSRLDSLIGAANTTVRLYSAPTERDPEWDATPGDTVTWATIYGGDESWAQSMVGQVVTVKVDGESKAYNVTGWHPTRTGPALDLEPT